MTTASVHRLSLEAARDRTQVRAFPLDYGVAIALGAGLLFAITGAVVMLASMPDGLRGSFVGVVFAAVGVLLAAVGVSIHTDKEEAS